MKALTPENFEIWAGEAGVDKAKFKASFEKNEFASKIDKDMAEGKAVGVTGTPASMINGVFLSGAQPVDKFTAVIDEQLKAAQAKVASGVKPEKVYAALAAENKGKNPPPKGRGEEGAAKETTRLCEGPRRRSRSRATPRSHHHRVSEFSAPSAARSPDPREVLKIYATVRIVFNINPLPSTTRQPASSGPRGALRRRLQGSSRPRPALQDQQKLSDDYFSVPKSSASRGQPRRHHEKEVLLGDHRRSGAFRPVQASAPRTCLNGRRLVGAQPLEVQTTHRRGDHESGRSWPRACAKDSTRDQQGRQEPSGRK